MSLCLFAVKYFYIFLVCLVDGSAMVAFIPNQSLFFCFIRNKLKNKKPRGAKSK